MSTPPPAFSQRPATNADEPLLYKLYATTRADELAPLGWSETQRHAFLRSQFAAQRDHFRRMFPHATYSIILRDQRPIGAIVVDRGATEIRLVDLVLQPAHRGGGLGTHLLRELMAEAKATKRPLRLHVLKTNPAARLYARLGFAPTGENGLYLKMEY